jgi:ATP-binding cassette subfamily B protein
MPPDEERMLQAARDANVYDNIIDFLQGFDTKLGERGITPGGRRNSIACALAKEPKILILDDALSAVDTENAILGPAAHHAQPHQLIITSHRVSFGEAADEILVLDDGQDCAARPHDVLMRESRACTARFMMAAPERGSVSTEAALGRREVGMQGFFRPVPPLCRISEPAQ